MNCKDCQSSLPDLLLDPKARTNAKARLHLESCPACAAELQSLQATFDLLDTWQAPEPSHYFDQKLAVRIREAQQQSPAGWFERLIISLRLNTGRQFRPAMAAALALVLVVGGGTLADLNGFPNNTQHDQASATINDLQILDKNDQTLQTMDQLLQDDSPSDTNTTTTGTPAS